MPAISSDKPYRVGRSRTGLGLFATQPIKKGTKIIRYVGKLLDCRKPKDDAIENKYLFQINSRWTIDGSTRRNIARYINHACRPNAESDVNVRKRRVVIRAIKNIAPGEEINYDYGTEYFKAYLKPIGCKCDACERKRAREREKAAAGKAAGKVEKTTVAGKSAKPTKATKSKTAKPKTVKPKTAKSKVAKSKTAKSKAVTAAPRKATSLKSRTSVKVAGGRPTPGKGAKAPRTAAAAARKTAATKASATARRAPARKQA